MKRSAAVLLSLQHRGGVLLRQAQRASRSIIQRASVAASRAASTTAAQHVVCTAAHVQSNGSVLKLHVTAPVHASHAAAAAPQAFVLTFHALWLRDHCRCPACTHPGTYQRIQDTFALPRDLTITDAHVIHDTSSDTPRIAVTWSHGGHSSSFPLPFLAAFAYAAATGDGASCPSTLTQFKSSPALSRYTDPVASIRRRTWTASTFAPSLPLGSSPAAYSALHDDLRAWPTVSASDLTSPASMAAALARFTSYGFLRVTGVAATDEATAAAAAYIAPPRRTLYGTTWRTEVKSDGNDTAYTTLALPAHTDCTYLDATPGVQVFHSLTHTGDSGFSLLIDAFAAAAALKAAAPRTYDYFTRTYIRGLHIDPKYHTGAWKRVLNLDPETGELASVAWNNDDRAPGGIRLEAGQSMSEWYEHARTWTATLRDPALAVWFKLTPGSMLVFDNTRVLHGRSEILPSAGARVLSGMYMDLEDVHSNHRVAAAAAGLYTPPYTLL